jgi:hypothetical protein
MKQKPVLLVMLIVLLMISASLTATFAQMQDMPSGAGSQTCEQCGMTVAVDSQAYLKVTDANGTAHYVECIMCALKLLNNTKYDELNITTYCDWYGPNYTVTIMAKQHGSVVTTDPPNALVDARIIAGGGCTKNRVGYNQTAVDALIANGYSNYTTMMLHTALPTNATIMTIAQAALKFGTGMTSPTPSPSPPVTDSPNLIVSVSPMPTDAAPTTKPCDACPMDVNADAQAKYIITDENGTVHYADCFMCALNLLNKYSQVDITTSCDWYGPNYTITVQSTDYGNQITVTPSTAMFLNGGSCVINRAAYNQTAADELLANGFSQYTLKEQQYPLPTGTNVTTVKDAAMKFANTTPPPNSMPTAVIVAAAVGGTIVIVGSVVAFKKLKRP